MPGSSMVMSVVKALDILRLAAEAADGMRLNEIADALDMKKTTAHNLIRTLRARGFLVKDAANRFGAGPALRDLARRQERGALYAAVGARLRAWRREFPDATLSFSELTPVAIQCRLRMSPDRPGELQTPLDRFFPPYASPTAICLQATANNAAAFERQFPFAEHGAAVWGRPETWLDEIRRVRADGFAARSDGAGRLAVAFAVPENHAIGFSLDRPPADALDAFRRRVEEFRRAWAEDAAHPSAIPADGQAPEAAP